MVTVPKINIKTRTKIRTPFWENHQGEDGFLLFHGLGSMEAVVAISMHRGNCILSSYVYYANYKRFRDHAGMVRKNAKRIFIDSGVLGLAKAGILESDWDAYQRRVAQAAHDFDADYVSHLDLVCNDDVLATFNLEKSDVLRITVENAKRFTGMDVPGEQVYVIQGWEPDDYLWCLDQYKQAGIHEQTKYFGVGSLVGRDAKETYWILKALRAEIPNHKIHAFGLANLGLVAKLREDGLINSTDNAMAMRLACLNKKYITPRWSANKIYERYSYPFNWWMNVYLCMFNMAALEQGLFLDTGQAAGSQLRLLGEDFSDEDLPVYDFRSLGFFTNGGFSGDDIFDEQLTLDGELATEDGEEEDT